MLCISRTGGDRGRTVRERTECIQVQVECVVQETVILWHFDINTIIAVIIIKWPKQSCKWKPGFFHFLWCVTKSILFCFVFFFFCKLGLLWSCKQQHHFKPFWSLKLFKVLSASLNHDPIIFLMTKRVNESLCWEWAEIRRHPHYAYSIKVRAVQIWPMLMKKPPSKSGHNYLLLRVWLYQMSLFLHLKLGWSVGSFVFISVIGLTGSFVFICLKQQHCVH